LLGALGGASAVALGAFAAHGLKTRVDANALAVFHTAVTYQFFHSIALCVIALWMDHAVRVAPLPNSWNVAAVAFMIGIVVFSGTLYGLALGGPRWLGAITPIGGVAFIVGWLAFAWASWTLGRV
jgi:uncharacterized membrane protein YgdD (TMEM256/DUF423 family)